MGFGSYDESEQPDGDESEFDAEEGVTVHEHTYDGEVSFDADASPEELLDRLQDMK